jgi:hypothetical protein
MESDCLYLIGSRYFQLEGSCVHGNEFSDFRCLRIICENRPLASSRPSVCPHVSMRLTMDGFPRNLLLWTVEKIQIL